MAEKQSQLEKDLFYSYKNVKSKFILEKIRKTMWKDRRYIDDLINIEKAALGKMQGMWSSYLANHLKEKYPKEWKAIHMELAPAKCKKMLQDEKKERKREKREDMTFQEVEKLENIRRKKEWLGRGGKK